MSEWISVKDRLPKDEEYPIVMISVDRGDVDWVDAWMRPPYGMYDISVSATHWMPLPEAPK